MHLLNEGHWQSRYQRKCGCCWVYITLYIFRLSGRDRMIKMFIYQFTVDETINT